MSKKNYKKYNIIVSLEKTKLKFYSEAQCLKLPYNNRKVHKIMASEFSLYMLILLFYPFLFSILSLNTPNYLHI